MAVLISNLVLFVQIAVEKFSEATVGYRQNREVAQRWVQLFYTPYFIVTAVSASHPLVDKPKIDKKISLVVLNKSEEFG